MTTGHPDLRVPGAAVASRAARDRYLARRLMYRRTRRARGRRIAGDAAFDAVTGGAAGAAGLKIIAVTLVLWLLGVAVIALVVAVFGGGLLRGAGSPYGYGALGGAPVMLLATLGQAIGLLSLLVLVLAFLIAGLIHERRYAADWDLAIEGGRTTGARVAAEIAREIARRRLPVSLEDGLGPGAGGHGSYLRAKQGPFAIVIGAVDFGTTVYVTWSMWSERSRFGIIGAFLGQLGSSLVGRGSDFHQVIRTDDARAMRDAIHDAVRAGIDRSLEA